MQVAQTGIGNMSQCVFFHVFIKDHIVPLIKTHYFLVTHRVKLPLKSYFELTSWNT